MGSGVMPLWNNLPHEREEYSEQAKKNQPALPGWSWLPLDRETSSLSPSKKFKSLYFCTIKRDVERGGNFYCFNWYAVDFKENQSSSPSLACTVCPFLDHGTTLSPVLSTMPPKVPRFFVAVSSGTRIYTIGGRTGNGPEALYQSTVFYFDTAEPEKGWKKGPSMSTGRCNPSAVVVDRKIYVFAGTKSVMDPYAEVLDPLSDSWELLPEIKQFMPTSAGPVHALLSDDKNEKRLLFHPYRLNALFSYNLETGLWNLFDEWFGNTYTDMSASVNGVLYCYFEPKVFGYDLLKRKWYSKPVRGLPRRDMRPPEDNPVFLFNIGDGRLCLFWSNISPDCRPLVVAVCTIFTVETDYSVHGGEHLTANIESVTRHYADGNGCAYCLAL